MISWTSNHPYRPSGELSITVLCRLVSQRITCTTSRCSRLCSSISYFCITSLQPKGISGQNTLDAATSHGQQPAGHQQIHGQHCYQPQHRTTSASRKENSPTSQLHTTIQQKEYLHYTFNTHTRNQQPKSAASFIIEYAGSSKNQQPNSKGINKAHSSSSKPASRR
ncbi:hypothetical protein Nepgr_021726 [Nepenthes gracilis]|uniref:Uncharacterized protein n=1 Tax=Nepenthes gracilis TaxID=150966 RepID=A0AAD3SZ96_NEPGR|nr:hypothetical protein Nepgr_021726 [Nepenthes gracilis]